MMETDVQFSLLFSLYPLDESRSKSHGTRSKGFSFFWEELVQYLSIQDIAFLFKVHRIFQFLKQNVYWEIVGKREFPYLFENSKLRERRRIRRVYRAIKLHFIGEKLKRKRLEKNRIPVYMNRLPQGIKNYGTPFVCSACKITVASMRNGRILSDRNFVWTNSSLSCFYHKKVAPGYFPVCMECISRNAKTDNLTISLQELYLARDTIPPKNCYPYIHRLRWF